MLQPLMAAGHLKSIQEVSHPLGKENISPGRKLWRDSGRTACHARVLATRAKGGPRTMPPSRRRPMPGCPACQCRDCRLAHRLFAT